MTKQPVVGDYAAPAPRSIGVDRTLAEAHQMMRDHRIRHLPVIDGERVIGLVSQRDLYFLETISGVNAEHIAVEEAMTHAPYTVRRQTPLKVAAVQMWKQKLGCALVVENRKLVGIFTTTDALQALVELLAGKPRRTTRRAAPRSALKAARPR